MATKVSFTTTKHPVPDAPATPSGLPDVDTMLAIRENCELLWMACREIAVRAGIPITTRHGERGYDTPINVTAVIQDMWDGFDVYQVESRRIRQTLYRYLKTSGNMVNTIHGSKHGRWWVRDEWDATPPRISVPGAQPPEPGSPDDHSLTIRYQCVYPGCMYPRSLAAPQMGIHVKTHGMTFAEYLDAAGGARDWPDPDYEAVSRALDEPDTATEGTAYYADPVAAVMALVEEVNRLRSLASDSGLAEENQKLRAELADANAKLAVLRRKQEAVDRAMGRR